MALSLLSRIPFASIMAFGGLFLNSPPILLFVPANGWCPKSQFVDATACEAFTGNIAPYSLCYFFLTHYVASP